jgi:uncharacterized protein (TIGR02444 family)
MSDTAAAQGSPFWRFSLGFYRQPGVAEACIALQEDAGVDVNLLLFLLWLASERRQLSAVEVAELESRIAAWRDTAVIPLRNLRRALKTPPPLIAAGNGEAFRTRIKAVELEAERLQQEAMYDLARASPPGTEAAAPQTAAAANIAAYERMNGTSFSKAAVETVLRAFAVTVS